MQISQFFIHAPLLKFVLITKLSPLANYLGYNLCLASTSHRSPKLLERTVLKPRYMTRISWRVNLVNLQRSSSATGTGLGARVGSSSYTTSSMGLSGGVAIFALTRLLGSFYGGQHYHFYRQRTTTRLSTNESCLFPEILIEFLVGPGCPVTARCSSASVQSVHMPG